MYVQQLATENLKGISEECNSSSLHVKIYNSRFQYSFWVIIPIYVYIYIYMCIYIYTYICIYSVRLFVSLSLMRVIIPGKLTEYFFFFPRKSNDVSWKTYNSETHTQPSQQALKTFNV
jgi:hypothetical protein